MKLTPEERAERRASFQKMCLKNKIKYLYAYYKLPISLGLIALLFLGSTVQRQLTKKDVALYLACVNVSVGNELEAQLSEGYLSASGADLKKTEVYLYRGLYLSDDPSVENHEYGYASRLKLMAAIEAEHLDLVLMNREAYDILSQNGYLLDLSHSFTPDDPLYSALEVHLTKNTVILEDNAVEYNLNEATEYHAVTEESVNGIDASEFSTFQKAGFVEPVYLGVVANSPRFYTIRQYIEYLR